jgi:methylated-DNA-[protein]-cysteine S-methyltransferase
MVVTIEVGRVDTPIGDVMAAVRDGRVCALGFGEWWTRQRAALAARFGALEVRTGNDPAGIVRVLRRYFAGDLAALAAVEVDLPGTPFQRQVWERLREIPAGSTTTYGALARDIGHARAVRAVGAANGANPIALVVPCHRVVGSDGTLTGYAGGLARKRWLLAHEARGGTLFRATS